MHLDAQTQPAQPATHLLQLNHTKQPLCPPPCAPPTPNTWPVRHHLRAGTEGSLYCTCCPPAAPGICHVAPPSTPWCAGVAGGSHGVATGAPGVSAGIWLGCSGVGGGIWLLLGCAGDGGGIWLLAAEGRAPRGAGGPIVRAAGGPMAAPVGGAGRAGVAAGAGNRPLKAAGCWPAPGLRNSCSVG